MDCSPLQGAGREYSYRRQYRECELSLSSRQTPQGQRCKPLVVLPRPVALFYQEIETRCGSVSCDWSAESSPGTPTTAGIPIWRARIAVCEVGPPCSVANPNTYVASRPAVSEGSRSRAATTIGWFRNRKLGLDFPCR